MVVVKPNSFQRTNFTFEILRAEFANAVYGADGEKAFSLFQFGGPESRCLRVS